ncbi:hypothetical protein MTR67_002076 [Solanum verrucosum]|uniref:Uncharacterized protein n=1 Tax=Solanum verrucosum TaxID=315347 RepID=A0AAF0T823_SOLVR|nr:hypothetical protein MTR67_002076 [Solanum verrucosum]
MKKSLFLFKHIWCRWHMSPTESRHTKNPIHQFSWTIDKDPIVEPIEQVIHPEPPLLPPTLLKVTSFNSFDYQAISFEFGTSQHIFTLYLPHI